MGVAMVGIGVMRVAVLQRRMAMRVGVLLAGGQTQFWVGMLMMFVVRVLVFMLHRLMGMVVLMRFSQVEPNTDAHQGPSSGQARGDGLAAGQGQGRAKERRH